MGGGTRMPKIQDTLKAAIKRYYCSKDIADFHVVLLIIGREFYSKYLGAWTYKLNISRVSTFNGFVLINWISLYVTYSLCYIFLLACFITILVDMHSSLQDFKMSLPVHI